MAHTYNGKEYDYEKEGIDYSLAMEEAAASGNYKQAAEYEQQRNAKIAGEGITDYSQTNDYAGWLKDRDIGMEMTDAMDAGKSGSWVRDLYDERYGIASGTKGMEQYVNDDIMQKALNYITNYGFETEDMPSYSDKYQSQIDELLGQYLNRDPFSYDHNSDPLYSSYKKQYLREGDRATANTMGSYASMTGGIPSTAAATAATQAGDYYATQLSDKIPELQQLAYQMYMDEGSNMRSNISMLQGMSDSDYGRYRDSVGDWRYDQEFDYQKYTDDWNKSAYEDELAYSKDQDAYDKAFDEAKMIGDLTGDYSRLYELLGYQTPTFSGGYYGGGGSWGGSSGGSGGGSSESGATSKGDTAQDAWQSYTELKNAGASQGEVMTAMKDYLNSGAIDKAQYNQMYSLFRYM